MTVEEYLRSLVPGLDLQDNVVERCAISPIEVDLDPLELDDDVDGDTLADEEFRMRLDYASSTVYYSVLGVFAGGGYSEQVGDVRASRGGYTITMADRARFKSMGDALRAKWGWEIEDDESSSEMYDATYLRR
jgi:hypothetical protein